MRANGWQSLAVTSAAPADGKALTAINLALSIAGDVNQNVVLVDLDLRHSTVARYLGLPVDVGVSDCLRRQIPVEEVLLKPDVDRLLILPNVHVEQHSSELVASPEMEALARRLVRDDPARIVIYDLPPMLSADDMLAFAPLVDAVLFVVCERRTDRTEVVRARELLEEVNVIGTVLNRSDERTAAYY
jgi:Mrp family chromosome partitioning ATPase